MLFSIEIFYQIICLYSPECDGPQCWAMSACFERMSHCDVELGVSAQCAIHWTIMII